MDGGPGEPSKDLSWENVGLAFSFIILDAVVSRALGLGVGTSLVTSGLRCVVQLSLVALILQKVFETNNPWAVAGIACEHLAIYHAIQPFVDPLFTQGLLNLMGTIETVVNKSKRRYNHMVCQR
ncbi:hypothetical protein PHLCEN_2v7574 [Hermanssonia centrifuga]|uniref:Uncharacterized protein n=1 Tax=Hermanssonia centrifuga TaxID=98765 RepID=A0A2R6NW62_9APHY|nr:hypothetical protein PHLCEN_2v7574 [Hermanssonia centrifuga]